MDFNLLQKEHRKELHGLTEWWKSLDCQKNLPFARDRLVECYIWALGVYFEPSYILARRILTKMIAMASIVDAIYDAYGTLDELILFTDAIERWHISASDQLPPCLRHSYQALLDVYSEMEEILAKDGRSDRVSYAIAEMKKLARSYFQEAKWFYHGYVPTMEEYLKTALVTGAYMMLATISLVGMGDSAVKKEAFDWITNEPIMLRASSVINRLSYDMVGHEFDQERGHVASALDCYMNEHGASKQEAIDEFQKQITDAWKDINKECLDQPLVSMPVLERVLNLTRVINLVYKDEDGYTHSTTRIKDLFTLVLVDPLSL